MKILFLAANPKSTSRLDLGEEARNIEEGLKRSRLSDKFEFVQRWAVRSRDLQQALLDENPNIVHFSGHGEGREGLVLLDNAGNPKPATGEALAGLFGFFPDVKCVLLNACYSAVQAEAIVQHVDYVIGMKDTILDEAAKAFSSGFYDALGSGRNFGDAFGLGRNSILFELASFSKQKTRQFVPVELLTQENSKILPENLKPILLTRAEYLKQETSSQTVAVQEDYPSTHKEDSLDIFRDRVKEKVADRNLNPVAKYELENYASELRIPISEARAIVELEETNLEKAKETYQHLWEQTIKEGFNPLDPKIQQDFQKLQQKLELTDSEVATITEVGKVSAQLEVMQSESNWNESTTERVINIFQGNYNETVQGDYIQGELSGERSSGSQVKYYREDLGNGVFMDMVKIPGGEFMMGSPEGEGRGNEKPQHKVTIQPFYIGQYLITQKIYKQIMGNNPSYFQAWGDTHPVENVSWRDTVLFCEKLSGLTSNKYRLPTEAEWEYACRAGIDKPFSFGKKLTDTHKQARYSRSSQDFSSRLAAAIGLQMKTEAVGTFSPNNFGLYDMHGNVWEWCADDWHDSYEQAPNNESVWLSNKSSYKVIRGGSWNESSDNCRSASRKSFDANKCDSSIGFRVVCEVPRTF